MGSTLSSRRMATRRRRKTTSAAAASDTVDYHQLTGSDVGERLMTSSSIKAKRTSRLLAIFTGRKSTTVACTLPPTDDDVISGNGAHSCRLHNNDSGYDEARVAH